MRHRLVTMAKDPSREAARKLKIQNQVVVVSIEDETLMTRTISNPCQKSARGASNSVASTVRVLYDHSSQVQGQGEGPADMTAASQKLE